MKLRIPTVLTPKSGKCDQDFSFMSKEKENALLKNIKGSLEESISDIDKLLSQKLAPLQIKTNSKI